MKREGEKKSMIRSERTLDENMAVLQELFLYSTENCLKNFYFN